MSGSGVDGVDGVTVREETIDRETAVEYLKYNEGNRRIRERRVRKFVELLEDGDFLTTHQGLAFDGNGALLDGQHRLLAITRTGIPARMFVTRGLDPDAFSAMDDGAVRTHADMLSTDGVDKANSTTTARPELVPSE